MIITWYQSRVVDEVSWSINSLDLVLGLVGGVCGIVWSGLAMVLGGYETFKLENSLIGAVYPTSPGINI